MVSFIETERRLRTKQEPEQDKILKEKKNEFKKLKKKKDFRNLT